MVKRFLIGTILSAAATLALVHMASSPAAAQGGAKPTAPKGKPAPRTADGKIDFSGVYYPPGRGPGDPGVGEAQSYSHNIARDYQKGESVPMLPWAQEIVK